MNNKKSQQNFTWQVYQFSISISQSICHQFLPLQQLRNVANKIQANDIAFDVNKCYFVTFNFLVIIYCTHIYCRIDCFLFHKQCKAICYKITLMAIKRRGTVKTNKCKFVRCACVKDIVESFIWYFRLGIICGIHFPPLPFHNAHIYKQVMICCR